MTSEYEKARRLDLANKNNHRASLDTRRTLNYQRYQTEFASILAEEVELNVRDQELEHNANMICRDIYYTAAEILAKDGEVEETDPLTAIRYRLKERVVEERPGGLYPNELYQLSITSKEITVANTRQVVDIVGAANQNSWHGYPRVFINPSGSNFRLEARPRKSFIWEMTEDGKEEPGPVTIVDARHFRDIVTAFDRQRG